MLEKSQYLAGPDTGREFEEGRVEGLEASRVEGDVGVGWDRTELHEIGQSGEMFQCRLFGVCGLF